MKRPIVRWTQEVRNSEAIQFRAGRAGDEFIAEWIGLGTLRASRDASWSEFIASEGADQVRTEQALRENIAALLRHLRGEVTLHASGVARDGIAMGFLGDAFAGKSTMAALLCRDPEMELVADDKAMLRIDASSVTAIPSETAHSLRVDVARALGITPGLAQKVTRRATRASREPIPLRALVLLIFDETVQRPQMARITGARAFRVLSHSVIRFALDESKTIQEDFDRITKILQHVRLYELRRARVLRNMDETALMANDVFRSLVNTHE